MKKDLIQFQIDAIEERDGFLPKFQKAGIENAKKLEVIKTKVYLGDYKGKKVNFYATYTTDDIVCTSSVDLELVGKNFDNLSTYEMGREKSYVGNYPNTRKGESNITKITLAYLLAYQHISTYKKVGFVKNKPSKELVRELMYLTMPEVEANNEDSKMYGVTWYSVIKAWNLQPCDNYDMFKKYFTLCVNTDLNNMAKQEIKSVKEIAS